MFDLAFKAIGFYPLYFDRGFKLSLLQREDLLSVDCDGVNVATEVGLIPAINILMLTFLPLSTDVLKIRHREWIFMWRLRSKPYGFSIFLG